MKTNLFFFILLASCSFSCTKQPPSEAQAEIASSESAFALTPEQIALAGIEVDRPQKRVISDYVYSNGRLELPPQNLVSVHTAAGGFVTKVNFLPGDFVRKGQMLCVLESPEYAQRQQQFLESKAQLHYLRQDLTRRQLLAETDATSQKALQQAQADFQIQTATYKGLKAQLGLMGFNVAQIEKSEIIQTRLSITSPTNGFISQQNINLGMLVNPNDLLYQLMDKSHLHLELQVFAKDLEKLREGQAITFNLAADDSTYAATVHLVGKMIDPRTNTTMVHGHLNNPQHNHLLTAGSFVNARIRLGDQEVTSLPRAAVVLQDGKAFVFVKNSNGYKREEVITGVTDEEYVEVVGFGSEKEVVVKGSHYLGRSES